MSHKLINLNQDLKRLRDEGYDIEVSNGYLIVRCIPYVNSKQEVLKNGILVIHLELAGNTTVKPKQHVINFIGEHPHNANGSIIATIVHGQNINRTLFDNIAVNHSFSNKPQPNGYENYYELIKNYSLIISNQAKAIDDSVSEKPFNPVRGNETESVFHYIDTNSSRANLNALNAKFSNQKVAIIGLGGTGAYILDMVAKSQVQEIHIFDGDLFLSHNAFRSPGVAPIETLEAKPQKVDYFFDIYSQMHKYIIKHNYYVTDENLNELDKMNYVFVCVDKNEARGKIINYLTQKGITLIDVGLGVNVVSNENQVLIGQVRTTVGTANKNDHLSTRIPMGNDGDNEYATNIQVADLNNLNAVLAVIKWKKLSGFYQDMEKEHNSIYAINVAQLLNEDFTT